ncbi:MAG TPA: hypothetical protein VNA69_16415 [Thermoanaerobaculia bacterium]|nr:hypothetical protein [Thermoanaerobaculia bacterium]
MDAMLTSFGLTPSSVTSDRRGSIFDRMPPAALDLTGQYLTPDYAVLLVCDHLVMDSEAFDRLTHDRHWSYNAIAEVIRALEAEGFLRLEDYSTRVVRAKTRIEQNVSTALELSDWNKTFEESVAIWQAFLDVVRDAVIALWKRRGDEELPLAIELDRFMSAQLHEGGATELSDDLWREHIATRPDFRRAALAAYLAYVETNIELSRQLGIPIYDWEDYKPFYDSRLRQIDQRQFNKVTREVRQLFSVSFPEFQPRTPSTLVKMLNDKRIGQLRGLVSSAARGEITFDRQFAVRTLLEVLNSERRIARFRSIASYALLPVGFVPLVGTPLAKAAEETIGGSYERAMREPFQWFYLISESQRHDSA